MTGIRALDKPYLVVLSGLLWGGFSLAVVPNLPLPFWLRCLIALPVAAVSIYMLGEARDELVDRYYTELLERERDADLDEDYDRVALRTDQLISQAEQAGLGATVEAHTQS